MRESWNFEADCQWKLCSYLKSQHRQSLLNLYLLLKGFLCAFQEVFSSEWVFRACKGELIIRKRNVAISIRLVLKDIGLMRIQCYFYLFCEIILALGQLDILTYNVLIHWKLEVQRIAYKLTSKILQQLRQLLC